MERVWKGPYEEGLTYSMLSKWLQCRERFRIYAIEGLKEEEKFEVPIIFGSLWHLCAESYPEKEKVVEYARELARKFRDNAYDVKMMLEVVLHQYQLYKEYWSERGVYREDLYKESEFAFKYEVDGVERPVLLRGKIDCICKLNSCYSVMNKDAASLVDSIIGKGEIIAIEETKTKGSIELEISTVRGNLQTLFYHLAARQAFDIQPNYTIYNVVLRPIGKIRKRKGETTDDLIQRLKDYVDENTELLFKKYLIKMGDDEFLWGKNRILDPILRQFCKWYDSIVELEDPFKSEYHYLMPWGIYNPLLMDMRGDYYEYIVANDSTGLERVESLFVELGKEKK